MTSKEEIKQELFEIAIGRISYWYKWTGLFSGDVYEGTFNSPSSHDCIIFQVSRTWRNKSRMKVQYYIPSDDSWNPRRSVEETFIFDSSYLYDTLSKRHLHKQEEEKKEKQLREEAYKLKEEELKTETLLKILEDAKTKNNSSDS